MRSLLFLAAVVVAGTWLAARHLPHAGEARAESGDKEVRTQEVQSISIDTPSSPRDERRLPISELRMLLATKPGDLLDQQTLESDRRAIEATLVARGYLAARVAPASVTFDNGGAYVVFDVARGPMYRLRSIQVTGPGAVDAEVVTLSPGDDAIRTRIDRARQTLADALAHRAMKPTVEVRMHEDHATASLDVELATLSR